eukprot:TRINITY_DN59904_c0_g1_i1.p1 TRINITY_DN59904_c0_g1~~TRINITY_DN59904_c0_g1_i1.p1  ORF type:complete len:240 (+),score=54.00 TRINITY_DN59904_c0_g1_i1:88-720(+)
MLASALLGGPLFDADDDVTGFRRGFPFGGHQTHLMLGGALAGFGRIASQLQRAHREMHSAALGGFGGLGGLGLLEGPPEGFMAAPALQGPAGRGVRLYHRRQLVTMCPSQGLIEQQQSVTDTERGVESVRLRRGLGNQWMDVERVREAGSGAEVTTRTSHNVREGEEGAWDSRWRAAAAQAGLPGHAAGPPLRAARAAGRRGAAPRLALR